MKSKLFTLLTGLFILAIVAYAQDHFSTSLHKTRAGKPTAYNKENGGFETVTGVPLSTFPCVGCHAPKYPDGEDVPTPYTPSCRDCHNISDNNSIAESTCLSCHSRKVAEVQMYPESKNPHTERGMNCWDCHKPEELHGDDGVAYNGMHDEGAIKAKCTNCHKNIPNNSAHTRHANSGKFECQACHLESIVQCQNCHLESAEEAHIKRAQTKIKDFQLLVKRNGKFTSGSFMTHVYKGKTNVIYSPLTGHLITKEGKTCKDCHNNMGDAVEAIKEYNQNGTIQLLKWDEQSKKLVNAKGMIPLVADWDKAFLLDFANYTGNTDDEPSDPSKWVFLKSGADNAHLFYAEALTGQEMGRLGFTRIPSDVIEEENSNFMLRQNYPNPADGQTRITYRIKKPGHVNLSVYDLKGNLVKTIVNHYMNANEYSPTFDTSELPSGSYIYTLSVGSISESMRMNVVH